MRWRWWVVFALLFLMFVKYVDNRENSEWHVWVIDFQGRNQRINILPSNTMEDLQLAIQEKTRVPPYLQELRLATKPHSRVDLESSMNLTLRELGITKRTIFKFSTYRMRGGMRNGARVDSIPSDANDDSHARSSASSTACKLPTAGTSECRARELKLDPVDDVLAGRVDNSSNDMPPLV